MLRTPAWKSLDAVARALYVKISIRYNGSNNGRISYSIREGAAALKIGKTKAAQGMQTLQDRGFIDPVTPGGFNRKDRHATEWRLAAFMCDVTKAVATHSYESWEAIGEIQNAVPVGGPTVPVGGLVGTHWRTKAA